MMLQMKSLIFWPRQRQDLEAHYKECKQCTENRISRPQMKNEVDMSNLFDNFFPGEEFKWTSRREHQKTF